ncbi:chaperone modulator CbpM [Desulfovibrio inopinatus]|uniref:chaperone modulator CbpM n=1 Tax=Desulfovibrio inopinatus TaxID=102109 RepID=UPI000406438C|nr:chaperone modulator CbpM [Desulfovibrio inopinatus]
MDVKLIVNSGLPTKSELIAWSQFLDQTGIHPSVLGHLIELGWISPVRAGEEQYLFRAKDVYRLRKLDRISRDLDISVEGASIIVDLIERIEHLENKVRDLQRLL